MGQQKDLIRDKHSAREKQLIDELQVGDTPKRLEEAHSRRGWSIIGHWVARYKASPVLALSCCSQHRAIPYHILTMTLISISMTCFFQTYTQVEMQKKKMRLEDRLNKKKKEAANRAEDAFAGESFTIHSQPHPITITITLTPPDLSFNDL